MSFDVLCVWHQQREVQEARALVERAQQALLAELQRAQQRERQLAAERAAAARDRAAQEQRAAAQRAAAQRALQAAATQVCERFVGGLLGCVVDISHVPHDDL